MKRPVTEEDLIADPSLATIGVKIGDEYEFDEAVFTDETQVPKFDPFTGKPLQDIVEETAKPEEQSPEVEGPISESNTEPEVDAPDTKDQEAAEEKTESLKDPITYAELLERGISLNKVEAADIHPGISNIAQWGDLVIRQVFKPEN